MMQRIPTPPEPTTVGDCSDCDAGTVPIMCDGRCRGCWMVAHDLCRECEENLELDENGHCAECADEAECIEYADHVYHSQF